MSLDRAVQEANETLRALLDEDVPEAAQALLERAHSTISALLTEVEEYREHGSDPWEHERDDALRAAISDGDMPSELRLRGRHLICDGAEVGVIYRRRCPAFVRIRFERLIERLGGLLEGR